MSFFGRRYRTNAETQRLARELIENAKRDMERMIEETKAIGAIPKEPIKEEPARMVCMQCMLPWWECEHGTWRDDGYALVISEPREPLYLFKGGKS